MNRDFCCHLYHLIVVWLWALC